MWKKSIAGIVILLLSSVSFGYADPIPIREDLYEGTAMGYDDAKTAAAVEGDALRTMQTQAAAINSQGSGGATVDFGTIITIVPNEEPTYPTIPEVEPPSQSAPGQVLSPFQNLLNNLKIQYLRFTRTPLPGYGGAPNMGGPTPAPPPIPEPGP